MKKRYIKHVFTLILIFITAFFCGAMQAHGESPLLNGTAPNVWVFDSEGETAGSYSLPSIAWTYDSNYVSESVTISGTGGQYTINNIGAAKSVMINGANNGVPRADSALPVISIIGLNAATLSNDGKPGVTISPSPNTYDETIQVTINGTPALGLSGTLILHWKINDGPEQTKTAAEADFFLIEDGTINVEYWATQDTAVSIHKTAVYELNVPEGITRDTDGDGIPDIWEIENGLNPLKNDILNDSDGDGWSDFEEIIRGSDPVDPAATPVDTDLDGWSDFDEDLRGTNPSDPVSDRDYDGIPDAALYPDSPAATRLYEVEYLISGGIYQDSSLTIPQTNMGRLTVLDIFWKTLYDQQSLPDAAELQEAGLTESDIPLRYRVGVIGDALSQGMLNVDTSTPLIRVPAGRPAIVHAHHLDNAGVPDKWVAKEWLKSLGDIHSSGVNAYINSLTPDELADRGLNGNWSTAAEWEAAYVSYMRDSLVMDINVSMSPESGIGIALLEGLVTWDSGLSNGALVLLGNESSPQPKDTINRIIEAIARNTDGPRTLNDLYTDLENLTAQGQALASFADTVRGYYADLNSFVEITTERASAVLALGNYLSRLLLIMSQVELDLLSDSDRALLMNPDADFDNDGLINRAELDGPPALATRPDMSDTDGDGNPDGQDPCPVDAGDFCALDPERDRDGDGIIDVFDNCPASSNQYQEDVDGDGMGDVCDICPNEHNDIADADNDGICRDGSNSGYVGDYVCRGSNNNTTTVNCDDNCPDTYNPEQENNDGDWQGDVCDDDDDNDRLNDTYEINISRTDPFSSDTDGDGYSDNAELRHFNSDPRCKESVPVLWKYRMLSYDITEGIPNLIPLANDTGVIESESHGNIPIGFNFKFYGNTYNTINASPAGIVFFDNAGYITGNNSPVADGETPSNIIAAFWDDLWVEDDSSVTYETTGGFGNQWFVMKYANVRYGADPQASLTFEIILSEQYDSIEFRYGPLVNGTGEYGDGRSATVGIENADGTEGVQYSYNGEKLIYEGLVVKFYPWTVEGSCDDSDGDGVYDDGDNSGVVGDNICTGDNYISCDDNCIDVSNRDQADINGDGVGDACDSDNDGLPNSWEDANGTDKYDDGSINPDNGPAGDPDGDGFDNITEQKSGSNPQSLDTKPVDLTIDLNEGFNLFSWPVTESGGLKSFDLLTMLGTGAEIEKIQVHNKTTNIYHEAYYNGTNIVGDNVDIVFSDSIMVYSKVEKPVVLNSTVRPFNSYIVCTPTDFTPGLNLVAFPCAPAGYTSNMLLMDPRMVFSVMSFQKFNPETGKFDTVSYVNGQIAGTDFPITAGEGYMINMKQDVNGFKP